MATLNERVTEYLGDGTDPAAVSSALAAERASQAARCRVPVTATETDADTWPHDLVEALCRRVQHNLAVRENPLGVETAASEFGNTMVRVGGLDGEVRRLEAPHRRLVVG